MRKILRRIVPSQFQRRLLLLAAAGAVVFAVLAGRLLLLASVQHRAALESAEAVLSQVEYLPTTRGRILDRHGRVLAQNRGCFNVAVRYPVISGAWAYEQGRRQAVRQHTAHWGELDYTAREALIAAEVPAYQRQVDQLWQVLAAVGEIDATELERRRQTVISRVSPMADYLRERRRQRMQQADQPADVGDVDRPIVEQNAFHPLLFAVSADQKVVVERLLSEARSKPQVDSQGGVWPNLLSVWNEVTLQRDVEREYLCDDLSVAVDRRTLPGPLRSEVPLNVRVGGVGLQTIGGLRGVQREDMAAHPFWPVNDAEPDLHGYRPGDLTGRWGIEQALEEELRGRRGKRVYRLDTGEQRQTAAEPGRDVRTSIDVSLQARIQALMQPRVGLMRGQPWHFKGAEEGFFLGQPLRGAAVVLEVSTGQVLAAVSEPAFSLRDLAKRPQWVWGDDLDMPYRSRVYGRAYPPGSTVKPVVLTAAVTEGRLGVGQTVTCEGVFDRQHPNVWRCWIYKASNGARTHGPLTGPEAIAQSCNVFFHTMGRRLGAKQLVTWYGHFGLGRLSAFGVTDREQTTGMLPELTLADEPQASGFTYSDAVFMAIGQGRVTWTPLQAANAYATLARNGLYVEPTFVIDPDGRPPAVDLKASPAGMDMALKGLEMAVADPSGTSHHLTQLDGERIFDLPGVRILAKSGTADPGRVWLDLDRNGQRSAEEVRYYGDHAWTVVLVQRPGSPRPDYAIAVLVEFGGSGGACAGPIANQILHTLRAEGYL